MASFYSTLFIGALGLSWIVGVIFLCVILQLGPDNLGGKQNI